MTSEVTDVARRRRHAHYIAALAHLVTRCGHTAGEVYQTIASDPTSPHAIDTREISVLAQTAPPLLEQAHDSDDGQWPEEVAREGSDRGRSLLARMAVRDAEATVAQALEEDGPSVDSVPMPTPEAASRMAVTAAAQDFLERVDVGDLDTEAAVDQIATDSGVAMAEILDEATSLTALTGLFALRKASQEDPGEAAEGVLEASRHFARAVTLASLDWA